MADAKLGFDGLLDREANASARTIVVYGSRVKEGGKVMRAGRRVDERGGGRVYFLGRFLTKQSAETLVLVFASN